MVLATKRTSTLWSEDMHPHPGARRSCGTAEARYQRNLDIQVAGVGVLPSGSLRGIPRRVVMSRDSPRLERDGARNTRI